MPKQNRRRTPRPQKGNARPKNKPTRKGEKMGAMDGMDSHGLKGDARARVVSRKSPKRTTADWGPVYLRRFAECGVMKDACEVAGVSYHTVWDRRQVDPAFGAAEEAARAKAGDLLESMAWDRAANGLPGRLKFQDGQALLDPRVKQDPDNPVFYQEREYDTTLLITLLKAHKPEKYREKVDVSGRVEHLNLPEFRERVAKAKASLEARA